MKIEHQPKQLHQRASAHRAQKESPSAIEQAPEPMAFRQSTAYTPGTLSPQNIASLQRVMGNRAVGNLVQRRGMAARSTLSKPRPASTQPHITTPHTHTRAINTEAAGAVMMPDAARQADAEHRAAGPQMALGAAPQAPQVAQRTASVMQRDLVQRAPKKSAAVKEIAAKLPVIQSSTGLVSSNFNLAEAYVNLSVASTDLISTKLQIFALNYDQSYSKYANVIGQGRAEAQNQTLWRGIFLGIGTGVLAGLAAAYVAPSTAAAWFTLTLADAATAAGSSFLQATASAAISYAFADAMTARGSDLQPAGISPDLMRSNIWKHVASMYKGALATTKVLANLHRSNIIFERLMAEMRVHIAGGESDYTPEDILRAANIMSDRINAMKAVFDELNAKSAALKAASASISIYNPSTPTVDQMEKDIWIMWIGSLSNDNSDILDLDAIEDHLLQIGILGPGGKLGVDFGSYTSEDDELAAIAAARPQATELQNKYDQAATQWVAPAP